MKTQKQKTARIHSLDSLRAVMMLLGIVIHASNTYAVTDLKTAGWPIKDPHSVSLLNDIISLFVHSFRMQIFFMVAGFFGAMLFYERKPGEMLKNRVVRIVFPFLVFLPFLRPAMIFAFNYTGAVLQGSVDPISVGLSYFSGIHTLIPTKTNHLWFLYYLTIITFVSSGLGLVLKKMPYISNYISNTFSRIIQRPILRVVIFAFMTTVIYLVMGTYDVETSNSFILNFNTLIYYFSFYMVGWVLFKSKHLLYMIMQYDKLSIVAGIILFSSYTYGMLQHFSYEKIIIIKSLMIWFLIFGITGLFIRYGSKYSYKMRYISDASYWVYLVHLPIAVLIPSFIIDLPLHATFKFFLVCIITIILCFVSYHYLVRATFIGKLLNGRKYSRKLSDIKQTNQLR